MNKQGNKQEQIIQTIIKGIVEEIPEVLQQLSQLDENQQKQILQMIQQKAEAGDANAVKAMQKLQNPKKAKLGSKLSYIQKLKGKCPEGQELTYMARGGKVISVCKPCMKKKGGKQKKKC